MAYSQPIHGKPSRLHPSAASQMKHQPVSDNVQCMRPEDLPLLNTQAEVLRMAKQKPTYLLSTASPEATQAAQVYHQMMQQQEVEARTNQMNLLDDRRRAFLSGMDSTRAAMILYCIDKAGGEERCSSNQRASIVKQVLEASDQHIADSHTGIKNSNPDNLKKINALIADCSDDQRKARLLDKNISPDLTNEAVALQSRHRSQQNRWLDAGNALKLAIQHRELEGSRESAAHAAARPFSPAPLPQTSKWASQEPTVVHPRRAAR